MTVQGIRIFDEEKKVLSIKLKVLLEEIPWGNSLNWAILFIDGIANEGHGKILNKYKTQANESKKGLRILWQELFVLEAHFFQLYQIVILGSSNEHALHRYANDQKMYQSCNIVIELIDSSFWEVFSSNHELIDRLKEKFNNTKLLEPNFER